MTGAGPVDPGEDGRAFDVLEQVVPEGEAVAAVEIGPEFRMAGRVGGIAGEIAVFHHHVAAVHHVELDAHVVHR
jgi:hypothetical protein